MRKKFFEIFEVEAAKHCPNLTSKRNDAFCILTN